MNFEWPVRIYIEDTDAGGIVYHANYLRFLERARTEWLRHLGISQEALRQQDCIFVVSELAIRYQKPARLDDELIVTLAVERLRRASLTVRQTLLRPLDLLEVETLATAQVELACTSLAGRILPLPAAFLNALQHA
ncbi:MAG: tol-pal system-associated acyl-CoA thioesterase [Pseudomonadota bacterium]